MKVEHWLASGRTELIDPAGQIGLPPAPTFDCRINGVVDRHSKAQQIEPVATPE
jgi:hypothetical protein